MRYNAALATSLYGTALLLGQVHADAEDVVSSVSSSAGEIVSSATEAVESVTSSVIERPTFTVCRIPPLSLRVNIHMLIA